MFFCQLSFQADFFIKKVDCLWENKFYWLSHIERWIAKSCLIEKDSILEIFFYFGKGNVILLLIMRFDFLS